MSHFVDYLIPTARNGYKPRLFRRKTLTVIAAMLLLIELAYLTQVLVVFRNSDIIAAVLPGVLTSLTNEARTAEKAPALVENPLLTAAATKKAEDMAKRGYFSHVGPGGELPWRWLDSAGYRYSYAGENLAVNFVDSKEVTDAWLGSPSHRANMMKQEFKEMGIGVARGQYEGREALFVVQFFGTPASRASTAPASAKGNAVPATPAVPTVLGETTVVSDAPSHSKTSFNKIFTSPSSAARSLYYAIGAFLLAALFLAIFIKVRIQHPEVILGGSALIGLALTFIFLNAHIGPKIVLPEDSEAAVSHAVR